MKEEPYYFCPDYDCDYPTSGIIYPLVVTGISQVLFPKANGQLIETKGKVVGSQSSTDLQFARHLHFSSVSRWKWVRRNRFQWFPVGTNVSKAR